ncbi:hypothetical protein YC2023_040194 [Brassica napus]
MVSGDLESDPVQFMTKWIPCVGHVECQEERSMSILRRIRSSTVLASPVTISTVIETCLSISNPRIPLRSSTDHRRRP